MSLATEDTVLTEFTEDAGKMALLADCMDNWDQGDKTTAEWPNNLLSNKLVVYGDGIISKRNEETVHKVSEKELELCRTISDELAAACTQEIGMGSEGGDTFSPFYVTAQLKDDFEKPAEITEELIRSMFADTIFPGTTMTVEPLEAAGSWWEAVCTDGADSEPDYFTPWHEIIRLFRSHAHVNNPVFVQLGIVEDLWEIKDVDYPPGTELMGSVLPRMALGLTDNGSIVGLFATVTQT